jgi:hypothetical protein
VSGDKFLDNTKQYVIPISETKFRQYIQARIEKEKALKNQVVVGLNENTHTFMLGNQDLEIIFASVTNVVLT